MRNKNIKRLKVNNFEMANISTNAVKDNDPKLIILTIITIHSST